MTLLRRCALIAVLALPWTSPATAQNARALFNSGRFDAAAQAARTEGQLALSARALLIQAAYGTTDRDQALALIDKAEGMADAALHRNTGDKDAALQKAIAVGYRAKLTRKPSDAKQARAFMEALVKAEPKEAEPWLALAGWHGEAVTTLGRLLAGAVLGAKRDVAVADFDKAVALGGNHPLYPTYSAIVLLMMDKDYGPKATALLERASRMEAVDGLDALMRRNANALLVPLRKKDYGAAHDLAAMLAPFGRITK